MTLSDLQTDSNVLHTTEMTPKKNTWCKQLVRTLAFATTEQFYDNMAENSKQDKI